MTAVEWLEKEFVKLEHTIGIHHKMYELLEQAKEMEKQQLIEMHDKGFDSVQQFNDDYVIEFTQWVLDRFTFKDYIHKELSELLEIFKKEREW